MKQIIAIAIFAMSISPAVAVADDSQLSGEWTLTFSTSPDPLEITMSFVEITVFFVGTSGPPDNCSWLGVDLPFLGQSSLVTGFMTCGEQTPTLFAFLFATATNRSMTGVMIAPALSPPIATFEGSVSSPVGTSVR